VPIVDAIQIEGLADLRRSLRALDADSPKAIRLAANRAAGIVVDEAQRGVPTRSGKARKSIKARSTQTAAKITSGGNKAPYMPWLDYGGAVGRERSIKRPFIAGGRYVYPALAATRKQVEEAFREELRVIADAAGLEI
jgi:hypothetical protein